VNSCVASYQAAPGEYGVRLDNNQPRRWCYPRASTGNPKVLRKVQCRHTSLGQSCWQLPGRPRCLWAVRDATSWCPIGADVQRQCPGGGAGYLAPRSRAQAGVHGKPGLDCLACTLCSTPSVTCTSGVPTGVWMGCCGQYMVRTQQSARLPEALLCRGSAQVRTLSRSRLLFF